MGDTCASTLVSRSLLWHPFSPDFSIIFIAIDSRWNLASRWQPTDSSQIKVWDINLLTTYDGVQFLVWCGPQIAQKLHSLEFYDHVHMSGTRTFQPIYPQQVQNFNRLRVLSDVDHHILVFHDARSEVQVVNNCLSNTLSRSAKWGHFYKWYQD